MHVDNAVYLRFDYNSSSKSSRPELPRQEQHSNEFMHKGNAADVRFDTIPMAVDQDLSSLDKS